MLDLHSTYDSTGSTDTVVTEATTGAIPANDGATTIGISPWPGAVLLSWGVTSLNGAAQAVVQTGMSGNNIFDPTNKWNHTATGTDVTAARNYLTQLGYAKGPNLVNYAQEAAGKILSHKIDAVGAGTSVGGSWAPANQGIYSITTGALTAGVYHTDAFAPTTTPPIGQYAILGTWTSNMTAGAALRFQHTDFKGAFPGYPIADCAVTDLAPNLFNGGIFSREAQGFQFVWLSSRLGIPCCPVFSIQGQGTGLNLQTIDCTGDTVTHTLNLLKVS